MMFPTPQTLSIKSYEVNTISASAKINRYRFGILSACQLPFGDGNAVPPPPARSQGSGFMIMLSSE